ncbi:ABC transporter substrate-binding protein [Niallia sp. Krafla_26]|uniref:ABC transporter substrate-binding protein n=1 Tax=Niallia sp. Krafla_26 TaxID=3064703 RepID=UPI003D17D7B1
MKKVYGLLFSLLLSIGILVGCGTAEESKSPEDNQQTDQTETSGFPVTVKDASDEEVVIEKKPERIISLMPSNTEIAFELGLSDEIVGVTDNDTYPEEVNEKEKVGGMEFNVEKIISLQPDLVLGHGSAMGLSAEGFQQLKDAGITVLTVKDATTFTEVYDSIVTIGKATGAVEEAEKLVSDMKAKVDEIQQKTAEVKEKKKVYIEIDPALFTVGKDSIMDEMLIVIGAENIVKESGWPQLDQEAVIAANPDVILTTYGDYIKDSTQQVLAREGWQDINAIKNAQVIDVDPDTTTRPGPRLVEGVEEFAKAVYPELFNE